MLIWICNILYCSSAILLLQLPTGWPTLRLKFCLSWTHAFEQDACFFFSQNMFCCELPTADTLSCNSVCRGQCCPLYPVKYSGVGRWRFMPLSFLIRASARQRIFVRRARSLPSLALLAVHVSPPPPHTHTRYRRHFAIFMPVPLTLHVFCTPLSTGNEFHRYHTLPPTEQSHNVFFDIWPCFL
jgi:hypothetical protein